MFGAGEKYAVVGMDKGTPEDWKNLTRNAERWSLAVEGLENQIKSLSYDEQLKFTLDDTGLDHAVDFLDERGGINAVAAVTRADNNKTPAEKAGAAMCAAVGVALQAFASTR